MFYQEGTHHTVLITLLVSLYDKCEFREHRDDLISMDYKMKYRLGMIIFLNILKCTFPLLGRNLIGQDERPNSLHWEGLMISHQTKVYTKCLDLEEYRLPQTLTSEVSPLMTEFQLSIQKVLSDTHPPGLPTQQPLFIVALKRNAQLVKLRQYSMTREAKLIFTKYINLILEHGTLILCQSPQKPPLLPVKKPGTNDYQLVKNLREFNK